METPHRSRPSPIPARRRLSHCSRALLAPRSFRRRSAASRVPFANLKPQAPINIRADAYGQTALNLSRSQRCDALQARHCLRVGSGGSGWTSTCPPTRLGKGCRVHQTSHAAAGTHGTRMDGFECAGDYAVSGVVRFDRVRIESDATPPEAVATTCLQALAWVYKTSRVMRRYTQRLFIVVTARCASVGVDDRTPRPVSRNTACRRCDHGCLPYSGVYDFRDLVMYGQSATGGPAAFVSLRRATRSMPRRSLPRRSQTPFFVTWSENDNVLCKAQSPPVRAGAAGAWVRAEGYMFPLFDHFWIHIDQQNPANLWTRTLRNWMTGEKI